MTALVIYGTRDPLLPFESHGRRLAAEIPGAQLMALEGGGHMATFTHRRKAQAGMGALLKS
jgi:pimeloyl-ACP methyl ester carboxylesterase